MSVDDALNFTGWTIDFDRLARHRDRSEITGRDTECGRARHVSARKREKHDPAVVHSHRLCKSRHVAVYDGLCTTRERGAPVLALWGAESSRHSPGVMPDQRLKLRMKGLTPA